jgi:FkbM family methyltransferase
VDRSCRDEPLADACKVAAVSELTRGEGRPYRRRTILERCAARIAVPDFARRAARAVYEDLLWLSTAGRGLRADLEGGETVRLLPECRGTSWNAEECAALREATREGDIVLEGGANVGAYTMLFAQWVGPGGHVFAFEPVPSIAVLLRRQLRLNRIEGRVTVIEAALEATSGESTLVAPGLLGINRPALPDDRPDRQIRVAAMTIDDFCEARGVSPSVLKLDVEGAELAALRGARRTLASPSLRDLFVEWHPSLWPSLGYSAADVQRELAMQGFSAEPLRSGDDVWRVEGICARLVRVSACAS